MLTEDDFKNLKPFNRGYLVYMCGCNAEEPNIPNESNPYEYGTKEYTQWDDGAFKAMLEAQDGEE